jgi:peptide/nickel transport system substrate-binding protein
MEGVSKAVWAVVAIVIVLVVAAAAIAMQKPAAPAPTNVTPAPAKPAVQNPDTIIVETIGEPDYLDPAVNYEAYGGEIIQNVYETLTWYNGSRADQIIPWLAERYEVSPDGMSYTFYLRKGIKFHDGTPFNATAVNYSLVRTIVIADPDGPAWFLGPIRGAEELMEKIWAGNATWNDVKAWLAKKPIEILDTYTVRINLDYPYAPFPAVLASPWASPIVSPSYVEAHGGIELGKHNDWMDRHAEAGTGPFIVKSWEPGVITMVANPNYWGGPKGDIKPKIKTVIFREVKDANTRLMDLLKGDADFVGVPATHIDQLIDINKWLNEGKIVVKPDVADKVAVLGPFDAFGITFLGLNMDIHDEKTGKSVDFQPFKDIRVRQAFAYAFDYKTFIKEVVRGFGIQPNGPIPKGMFGYDPSIPVYEYNLTKAKELLLAAGKDLGFSPDNPKTLTLYYNSGNVVREKACLLLASAINSLHTGLNLQIVPLDWPAFLSLRKKKAMPIFVGNWIPDYMDPDDYLVPFGHGEKGTFTGYIGFNDPELNKLIDEQAKILDPEKRKAAISEIVKKINEKYVYIWLIQGQAYEVHRTWIKGWFYNPAFPGNYYAVLWKE